MTDIEYSVPDCLVFKFEEIDSELKKLDQSVFVFYDHSIETYVIRGRRRNTHKIQSCTFSYECDNEHDASDFLEYIFCKSNIIQPLKSLFAMCFWIIACLINYTHGFRFEHNIAENKIC